MILNYHPQFVETRLPLTNLTLANKLGRYTQIERLQLQYVLSSDKRLLRLKPFMKSPVTWFRAPYAHIILVHTADVNEYRSATYGD